MTQWQGAPRRARQVGGLRPHDRTARSGPFDSATLL